MSVGHDHACGVKTDGTLVCWGDNTESETTLPSDNSGFGSVAAGKNFTCAAKTTGGAVSCWGARTDTPTSNSDFATLDAGVSHACGRTSAGAIVCWGDAGQDKLAVPNAMFTAFAVGDYHTCGRKTDGVIVCWGSAPPSTVTAPEPDQPPPASAVPVYDVGVGNDFACARNANSQVFCWGNVAGDEDNPRTQVPADTLFATLVVAKTHACGIVEGSREVNCWGDPSNRKLQAPAGGFASIAVGDFYTCGVKINGSIACWGKDTVVNLAPPPELTTAEYAIELGNDFACVLKPQGAVICWGDSVSSARGVGKVAPGSYTTISAGSEGSHACGVRREGTIAYWGAGNINSGEATVPDTEANPNSDYRSVVVGDRASCGLKNSGAFVCWGIVMVSQLAKDFKDAANTFVSMSSGSGEYCGLKHDGSVICTGSGSVAIPPATGNADFMDISVGERHACGVKTDGSMVCWGFSHSIKKPPTNENNGFIAVSVASTTIALAHTCGIKTDGRAYCYGLADRVTTPSDTDFVDIGTNFLMTCAVKSDGRAKCWGNDAVDPPSELRASGSTGQAEAGASGAEAAAAKSAATEATVAGVTVSSDARR